ncbi:hypothetical protein [Geomicrobium sp. JCM 19039]|uniref:hypothetical protein n=1 Tax=Geomicrobium sp. JCM 19039 TaxID=1460636 RepID=UPI00045F31B0|nr:hypothetical protein [Geomicrobium sp. JCM 19039]GAK13701.1 hypothetical protein JCM19039_3568 [Geomicrobium sp. JCM 19039]
MFDFLDLLRLLISAFVILPFVSLIRESGYYLVATLLGAKNKKIIIGCGPKLFSLPSIEVRRYFFMFSWCHYDDIRPDHKFWHALIYASPMLSNILAAVMVNIMLGFGLLPGETLWNTFLFYTFYFVLFDALPVYMPDGQPTNGRAIWDLFRHDRWYTSDNRDRDEQRSTEEQKKTMENRKRDEAERGDVEAAR